MGMFDSVWVKCPKCGKEEEFQSKSGKRLCDHYDLSNCPDDVFQDINRHSPHDCVKCGTLFAVDMTTKQAVILR